MISTNILTDKEYASVLVAKLKEVYPEAECALDYKGEGWKLLVMARLSAQCTDKRVNIVCKDLFDKWKTPSELANADIQSVEKVIRSCGLYKTKARDIVAECKILTETFGGILPNDMETLLTFPGVGRKIANLLLGDVYSKPAIVVDTHCIRISRRMGLVLENIKAPEKIEVILADLIAKNEQSHFCHRIVMLGREYCPAKNHDCTLCPLNGICRKIVLSK